MTNTKGITVCVAERGEVRARGDVLFPSRGQRVLAYHIITGANVNQDAVRHHVLRVRAHVSH